MKDFPIELLRHAKSAACFFCAAFGGKQDVKYVCDAGIQDVMLVDLDGEKLDAMKLNYPSNWRYIQGDAFQVVKEVNRRLDIVICDPFLSMSGKVLGENFDAFYSLARKWFICTMSLSQPLPDYSKLLDKKMFLTMRNSDTGTCWLSIQGR